MNEQLVNGPRSIFCRIGKVNLVLLARLPAMGDIGLCKGIVLSARPSNQGCGTPRSGCVTAILFCLHKGTLTLTIMFLTIRKVAVTIGWRPGGNFTFPGE